MFLAQDQRVSRNPDSLRLLIELGGLMVFVTLGRNERGTWLGRVVEMGVRQKRVEVVIENECLAAAQLSIMGT